MKTKYINYSMNLKKIYFLIYETMRVFIFQYVNVLE